MPYIFSVFVLYAQVPSANCDYLKRETHFRVFYIDRQIIRVLLEQVLEFFVGHGSGMGVRAVCWWRSPCDQSVSSRWMSLL